MTNWRIFADRENAIEYIIKNKPILNYNEIVGFSHAFISIHENNVFTSTLKDLIKQKLKL